MTRTGRSRQAARPSHPGSATPDVYESLIDAVVWTVHQHGYAGATMDKIASRAGFTRGALQHYFGNRRVDVMAKVTSELLAERQALYEARYGDPDAPDKADFRAEVKAAFRDPRTWFLIEVWIASRSDPELHQAIGELQDRIEKLSDLALETSFRATSGLPFPVLKAFLRSLTRGLALEYSRSSDEQLFDKVVDLAFDALEALP